MKSERRHQLQQNELADALGSFIDRSRPYAPAVITVVVVLVLVVLGWGFFQSLSANKRSEATLSYLLETGQSDPEALSRIADEFAGTQAALLARLTEADTQLAMGIQALYTDRDEAAGRLEDAVAAYRSVLEADPQSKLIRSRATFGLAQALESTPGQAEEARQLYQQVVELNESEAIVEAAQQGIARLKRPEIQEFLAWFGEHRPQPAEASLPPDLPDSALLPDNPDLQLPETSPPTEAQEDSGSPGAMQLPSDAQAQPAADDGAPANETPEDAPAPADSPEPAPSDSPEPAPSDSPEPAPSDSPEPAPADSPEPAPADSPEPAPSDEPEPAPSDEPAAVDEVPTTALEDNNGEAGEPESSDGETRAGESDQ